MPTLVNAQRGRRVEYNDANYSFARASRSMVEDQHKVNDPGGREGDVSDFLTDGLPASRCRGLAVPLDQLGGRKRSLDLANSAGFVAPPTASPNEFTDVLRRKSAGGLLGVRFVSLFGGHRPANIPTKSAATAVGWIADGSPAPSSQPDFVADPDSSDAKTLAATMIVDRKVWKASDSELHDYLVADLAVGFAAEIDRAIIAGAGGLEPTGLLTLDGVPAMAFGTNGGPPTRAALVAAMKAVHNANGDAAATASMGWLTSPDGEAVLRLTDGSAGESGAWLWSDSDRILGKRAVSTTSVPANLTKGSGTGLTALAYGAWSDVLVNHAPAVQISIDPRTYMEGGAVRITAFLDVRILFRHAASFVLFKDMTTS